jgi:hypothetical protein
MNRQVERQLALLRANREQAAREMKRLDVEIGRVADAALSKDEYLSKSSIGRLLGISHTHVSNLIEASRSAPEPAGSPRIPVMENTVAGEYVTSVGARVVRSISAFHEGDVLVQSGLDPRLFAEDGRDSLDIPEMLWQLDNGEWVGVGMVSVGYGGTGPGLAREALERAGVESSTASEIVRWRFCDAIDVDDPATWVQQTQWPVHARSTPRVSEDKIILLFGDALDSLRAYHGMGGHEPTRPAVDESGFYPSALEESPLQAWLNFLDDSPSLPQWARGPRVARVFRNDEAAAEAGFTAASSAGIWSASSTRQPCIVIEQGDVQLWGFYYRPRDTTKYLPDEAYDILGIAGVYPESLVERDARVARPWSRFIANFVRVEDGLPDAIDVSATGSDHLQHLPTRPVRY